MAVSSVDMERALTSRAYARQVWQLGKLTAEQKGQITEKYGADVVKEWTSVDGTKYEIDDVSYDAAKEAGKKTVAESVGHDGSTGSTVSAIGSAAGGAAVTAGALAPGAAKSVTQTALNVFSKDGPISEVGTPLGDRAAEQATENAKNSKGADNALGDYATVILAAAVAAKYYIENPNKDQAEAAEKLTASELPQGQEYLYDAQNSIQEATDMATELAEEAEDVNEEANDEIEKNKVEFDYYRAQYEGLKAKKESGEKLTEDEIALMKKLTPMMEDLSVGITDIENETSETVNDLNDDIGDYQEIYDNSAETMAEVEGVTDFAEGFDETTRTLCYVEGAGQTLNSMGALRAAARLSAGSFWNWAFAAIGYAAALASGNAARQQFVRASTMTEEIHARRDVQELNGETTELYDEHLDAYAGTIETVEDLELEIPDDLEIPTEDGTGDGTTDPTGGDGSVNPFASQPDSGQGDGDKGDDDKKPDEI